MNRRTYMLKALKNWLKTFNMTNEERFLSQSVDVADFQARLKYLENQDRERSIRPYCHT